MKASMGFGLRIHTRFLIPFMLRGIQLDEWCDVGNVIIRLQIVSSKLPFNLDDQHGEPESLEIKFERQLLPGITVIGALPNIAIGQPSV